MAHFAGGIKLWKSKANLQRRTVRLEFDLKADGLTSLVFRIERVDSGGEVLTTAFSRARVRLPGELVS